MSHKKSLVVVGSCNMDFMSYAPRLPIEGETIHGHTFVTGFGGKGANQCVAAAKLGAKTTLIGRVGNDMWGEKYKTALQAHNVCTDYFHKTDDHITGVASITVSDKGANQIVIVAGANLQLSNKDIINAEECVKSASVLLCTLETPAEVAICAMELNDNGVKIMNGAPALKEYDPRLLSLASIFCVNETEAHIFSGVPVKDIESAKEAIRVLFQKECKSVIITLGSEGALFGEAKNPEVFHYVKSPKVQAIDTTGAGDAFIGALGFMLSVKTDILVPKAIEFACCVAADSVTKTGTQSSFPGPEILEKLVIAV